MTDIPEDVMKLARTAAETFTWSSTTTDEATVIARAIMQDRASRLLDKPEAVEGDAADEIERLRVALREFNCPRPANDRPDDFEVGQCVDAGECGCGARFALTGEPVPGMGTTLQEKLKMAEDALKPFAEAGDELGGSHLDKSDIWESHVAMNITAGDLRRARTTISQIRSEK